MLSRSAVLPVLVWAAFVPLRAQVLLPCRTDSCQKLVELPSPNSSRRLPTSDPFALFLRQLPLKPVGTPVFLFNGQRKGNQSAHWRVVDLDVGQRDLQQCADALIRLRAEFLYRSGQKGQIQFDLTNGQKAGYAAWMSGHRPRLVQNRIAFQKTAAAGESYQLFRQYLDFVFTYAGTASLARELDFVAPGAQLQIGDVLIQGGFPGHAVMILDLAERAGEPFFLLGQSFMPAQEFHVLRNPSRSDPWYSQSEMQKQSRLATPEWDFQKIRFQRWR